MCSLFECTTPYSSTLVATTIVGWNGDCVALILSMFVFYLAGYILVLLLLFWFSRFAPFVVGFFNSLCLRITVFCSLSLIVRTIQFQEQFSNAKLDK